MSTDGPDPGRPRAGRPAPWVARAFSFRPGTDHRHGLAARMARAPERLADLLRLAPPELVGRRGADGSWSVLEHAGHLADLEDLMDRRLSEFLAGAEVLSAADMTNRATEQAQHNRQTPEAVLARFRTVRGELMTRVAGLEPSDYARTALHPRLRVPMRVVDWMEFTAEHDDHHLATIAALLEEGAAPGQAGADSGGLAG